MDKKNRNTILICILVIMLLCINFFLMSIGRFFELTAIKSLIQQVFFVVYIMFFVSIDKIKLDLFESSGFKQLPFFVFVYVLVFFTLYLVQEGNRFGAALGPQALAFIFTIMSVFYASQRKILLVLFFFIMTIPTLSRTYLLIQVAMIVILLISIERNAYRKVLYLFVGTLNSMIIVVIAPFISDRLNYYDKDFFGTFMGRFKGFEASWDMINLNPFWGNGIGSILITLKDWSLEHYIYYSASGDTTIVHNEYLRVLVESGVFGFLVYFFLICNISSKFSKSAFSIMIVFLVASLVENTISLYSGPVFALVAMLYISNESSVRNS